MALEYTQYEYIPISETCMFTEIRAIFTLSIFYDEQAIFSSISWWLQTQHGLFIVAVLNGFRIYSVWIYSNLRDMHVYWDTCYIHTEYILKPSSTATMKKKRAPLPPLLPLPPAGLGQSLAKWPLSVWSQPEWPPPSFPRFPRLLL